ncbi:Mut7-C RNAse domain-containing protein [Chloroflexota bacterium]
MKFIVDSNAGKLVRWLMMMGYDALFFNYIEDTSLVDIGLREDRVVLTKDTQIMRRRVVVEGQVKAILLQYDDPREQLHQVIKKLKLDCPLGQFTRCLECNHILLEIPKEQVRELVPPYVFRTQTQFMQCPSCLRVYWRGTHWQRMKKALGEIAEGGKKKVITDNLISR